MFIRGTNTKIPLDVRARCSRTCRRRSSSRTQRQEKVDLRVLPVIFRFEPPPGRAGVSRASWSTSTSGRSDVKRRWLAILAPGVRHCGLRRRARLPSSCGPDRPALHVRNRRGRPPSLTGRRSGSTKGRPSTRDWWRFFGCPALDTVVVEALAGNPGLDAARATLRKNQDSLRAGYGVFFPQVDAHAGASVQRYNPAPGAIPSNTFNLFTLSGTVSYTLDLWGGTRRQVEALGAAVDAQRYALAGAYIMLSSNVVNAVIAQAAYRAEIDATKATRRAPARAGADRQRAGDRRDRAVRERPDTGEPGRQHRGHAAAARAEDRPGDGSSGRAAWDDPSERGAIAAVADRLSRFPKSCPSASRRSSSASVPTFSSPRRSCMRPTRPSAWRRRRCSPT